MLAFYIFQSRLIEVFTRCTVLLQQLMNTTCLMSVCFHTFWTGLGVSGGGVIASAFWLSCGCGGWWSEGCSGSEISLTVSWVVSCWISASDCWAGSGWTSTGWTSSGCCCCCCWLSDSVVKSAWLGRLSVGSCWLAGSVSRSGWLAGFMSSASWLGVRVSSCQPYHKYASAASFAIWC